MSIVSAFGRIAREYRSARARFLTERAIRDLPMELQKDIGWPDAADLDAPARHRFPAVH
jgi:hypothetical protein